MMWNDEVIEYFGVEIEWVVDLGICLLIVFSFGMNFFLFIVKILGKVMVCDLKKWLWSVLF